MKLKNSNASSSAVRKEQMKQRVVKQGVKLPPKHVQPRAQVASNMRAAEIICDVNYASLDKVVKSMVQFAISKGWFIPDVSTNDKLNTPMELYYGLFDDLMGAMRPRPSHYLASKGVPLWYREYFEAFMPGNQADTASSTFSYKWGNLTEEDNSSMSHIPDPTLIGENSLGDWIAPDTNGMYRREANPATPTHDQSKDAVIQFFTNCLALGHVKWNGNKTIFLDDTSVFAFSQDLGVVADTTVDGQAKTLCHEVDIRHNWLASLHLVKSNNVILRDRFAKHVVRGTAGPGPTVGHRLIRGYVGNQGNRDILHFKTIDLFEFETQMISLINGAEIKRLGSSAQKEEQKLFETGAFDKMKAYINFAWLTQHMSSTPVVSSVVPRLGTKLQYGTAFLRPNARTLERLHLPELIAENMRMLHPTEVETKPGPHKDFYYGVPLWTDVSTHIDLPDYLIPNWEATTFTSGYDPMNMNNVTAYNYVNTPGSPFKDYIDTLQLEFHNFSEYHNLVSMSPHLEAQTGAQLMLLDTSNPATFALTKDGMVCFPVETAMDKGLLQSLGTNTLKHIRSLIDYRDNAVVQPSIFERFMPTERRERLQRNREREKNVRSSSRRAPPITLGINSIIPETGRFDVFKQLVLPKVNVDIGGSNNNVSAIVAQFGIRDTARVDSAAVVPQLEVLNSTYIHTKGRGATASNQSELMKVLRNKANRGLGSAQASPQPTSTGLMGKVYSGVGSDVIDDIVGLNPYLSMANTAGGWIMDAVDSVLGSSSKERQAARQKKRQDKKTKRKK